MNLSLVIRAVDQFSGVFRQLERTSSTSVQKLDAISAKSQSMGMGAAATGLAMGAAILQPVKAYMAQEQALTDLSMAFDTVNGKSKFWPELVAQTEELGQKLPGTLADYANLLRAMKEGGISDEVLAKGGFRAAAYLKVLGKLAPEEAGKLTAIMSRSFGIAGEDMTKFVDIVQRAKFSFGLDLREMSDSIPYMAAGLKGLKVQGFEASKGIMALMGAGREGGLQGSMLGTSAAGLIESLPLLLRKLEKGKGYRMRDAEGVLAKHGIELEFFTKEGAFRGIPQMVGELDKLKAITSDKERLGAINSMFGDVAGRLVAVLGSDTYNTALKKLADQESLQKRINTATGTFSNLWEAATGTITVTLAKLGETVGPELKTFARWLNASADGIASWSSKHPTLTRFLFVTVTGVTLLTLGMGGLGLAVAGFARTASLAMTGIAMTSGLAATAAANIKLLAEYMMLAGGPMKGLLMLAGDAGWGRMAKLGTFLTSLTRLSTLGPAIAGALGSIGPAGWIILAVLAAISIASLLVWKNWTRLVNAVKPFLPVLKEWKDKLWAIAQDAMKPLREAMGPLRQAWGELKKAMSALWVQIRPLLVELDKLYKAFMRAFGSAMLRAIITLLKPFAYLLGVVLLAALYGLVNMLKTLAWALSGIVKAITWVIQKFTALVNAVTSITKQMKGSGKALMDNFAAGIKAGGVNAVRAVATVVAKVRRFLPFSPAKEGPLSDIHRIRFFETVADGLKPEALLSKIRGVMALARAGMTPGRLFRMAAAGAAVVAGAAGQGRAQASVSIDYHPSVKIEGGMGTPREIEAAVFRALSRDRDQLGRMVEDALARRGRVKFSGA